MINLPLDLECVHSFRILCQITVILGSKSAECKMVVICTYVFSEFYCFFIIIDRQKFAAKGMWHGRWFQWYFSFTTTKLWCFTMKSFFIAVFTIGSRRCFRNTADILIALSWWFGNITKQYIIEYVVTVSSMESCIIIFQWRT